MNKKIVIGTLVVILLAIAYWLISPFWRNTTLNETLPGVPVVIVEDTLPVMDPKTKADFERQTAEMKDKTMQENDAMPSGAPSIKSRAHMVASAHDVSGEALIVTSGNESYLRFENLKTINGPDLRIYLAADLNGNDFIDLGPIRATEGSVNYAIPAGTDLLKYKYAMIWCRSFGVLFSYAQL